MPMETDLLSAVGIFVLVANMVTQRTREIGILNFFTGSCPEVPSNGEQLDTVAIQPRFRPGFSVGHSRLYGRA